MLRLKLNEFGVDLLVNGAFDHGKVLDGGGGRGGRIEALSLRRRGGEDGSEEGGRGGGGRIGGRLSEGEEGVEGEVGWLECFGRAGVVDRAVGTTA